jgi:hypothetical protein
MFEIIKAATMKISIFWDVTPCNLILDLKDVESTKPIGIITTLRIRVLEMLSSNPDRAPAIMTEASRGFSHALQTNISIIPRLGQGICFPNSFQFI